MAGVIDSVRASLSRGLFSPLQGMSWDVWLALLRQNGLAVDPPYWPRASFQTAISVANAWFARREEREFGARIDAVAIAPPLFILGHWRHGTTHLHNLLSLDPRFAYPTLFQTLYPRTFLSTEAFVPRLGAPLLLRTRPHDGIAIDFGVPNEDELAVCVDSGLSPYLSWAFPGHAEFYDRFLTFKEATDDQRGRWEASLGRFLKKLTLRYDRPLILKSPTHTARIALLLGMFPGARFVHIRRDPFEVFRSTRHMYEATLVFWRLQGSPSGRFDERIIAVYREMYDAFFEQRDLIPAGQFCEVRYEELVADPIGQVERIYRALGLPGLSSLRPPLEGYLRTIAAYRKNVHPELPGPIRERIAREWRRCLDEWEYAR